MLSVRLCLAQSNHPNSSLQVAREQGLAFAREMEQEAATVELQVSEVGNFKVFSISSRKVYDNQAVREMRQNQARQASEVFREDLKLDPDDAEAHYFLALALAGFGDLRGEQDELESAVRLNSNLAQAHNQLGILDLANNKIPEAEREFKAAISINPHFAEAENNLGVLNARRGRDFEAIQMLRQALQERPNYVQAFVNLGLVLAGEERYDDAEKEFRNALQASPDDQDVLTAVAMTVARQRRGEAAVEILQRLVLIHPGSAPAHLNLGMMLAHDGFDLPGALEQLSEAIRLDPNSSAAHYNKGRVLYDMNQGIEARAELDAACRLEPDYPAALYVLSRVEKELGNIQRSTEVLERQVMLEPGNAEAQYLLGQNLLLLGKTQEAVQHLQIAVDLSPDSMETLYNLAQALKKEGNPEAKAFMDRFQKIKNEREVEDRVKLLGSLGLEAAKVKDWPQAVSDFKEALELCGQCASSADLHRNLGLIYGLKGDIEAGKRELETALKIKPDDADARRALVSLQNRENSPQ